MEYLDIVDSRTGKSYIVPIQNGYIKAQDICMISAPDRRCNESESSEELYQALYILDGGLQYTACMKSSITLMYSNSPFDLQPLSMILGCQ